MTHIQVHTDFAVDKMSIRDILQIYDTFMYHLEKEKKSQKEKEHSHVNGFDGFQLLEFQFDVIVFPFGFFSHSSFFSLMPLWWLYISLPNLN